MEDVTLAPLPDLPEWVESFRDQQLKAVDMVMTAFESGRRWVLLDAPTGVGKSLVGELVRRQFHAQGYGGRSIYTAHTLTLQDQLSAAFPYARMVKGRDNYPTGLVPEAFHLKEPWRVTCDDCEGHPCRYCESPQCCPYQAARDEAGRSDLAICSYAYLLRVLHGAGRGFCGRDLLILDECDTLESIVMSTVEVYISTKIQEELALPPVTPVTVCKSSQREWLRWAKLARTRLGIHLERRHDGPVTGHPHWPADPKLRRRKERQLNRLATNLDHLIHDLDGRESGGWVYASPPNPQPTRRAPVIFKPVRVDHLMDQWLWQHGKRFLLMSASVISGDEMCDSLGIPSHQAATISLPSTFPIANRPIIAAPIADMSKNHYAEGVGKMAKAVRVIMDMYAGQRILIHTVSYKLASDLQGYLHSPRVLTYNDSHARGLALQHYLKRPDAVVLAPSFDRGLDLPEDNCRCVVVCKIPYPYLGDRQVSARLHSKGGQLWYCVAPETRILGADLQWYYADEIMEGMGVVAFDENGAWRHWRKAKVEGVKQLVRPTYRIHLVDGSSVVSSAEHRWLVTLGELKNGFYWETTERLSRPHKNEKHPKQLLRVLDVWDTDHSRDAGYIAGIFDGEGYLSQVHTESPGRASTRLQVGFSQNRNGVSQRVESMFGQRGFTLRTYGNTRDSNCQHMIGGGRPEILRFLGQIRPQRLLEKLEIGSLGMMYAKERVPIQRVEYLGERPVIAVQTTERTFIANGFASHNSVQTIRTLVQMTGRGVRSETDYADSYILDSQFFRLYGQSQHLFPKWWRDAIDTTGRGARLLRGIA